MNWWQAVVLGLVEGITEYLPVSSTGHLILASEFLGLNEPAHKDALDSFQIIVQGGAILAVVGLYWPRFVQMFRGVIGRDPVGFRLAANIAIAFMPAAVVGVVFKKWISQHLFYAWPVVLALVLGGVYMIVVEAWRSGRIRRPSYSNAGKGIDDLTVLDALTIGLLQIIAMWPGTSRSMMTITGGYIVRLRPAAAAEFSFLLGVPTLLGATILAIVDDYRAAHPPSGSHGAPEPMFYQTLGAASVLIGIAVAGVSAALAVKWLVGFLNRRGLAPFGVYRIVLGVVIAGLILGQIVRIAPEERGPAAGPASADEIHRR